MAHYPGAVSRPVPSHGGPLTAHLGLILHVTTNWSSPYGFFSNTANSASSNWWVAADGTVEEYVDPDLKAWAQSVGNATYNSAETDGTPDKPLTAAQVEALAGLYAWGHRTYGWPLVLAEKPGDPGLGWHGMGGALYGGHFDCPGDLRKAQRQAVLDRAAQLLAPPPAAPTSEEDEPMLVTSAGQAWYQRDPDGLLMLLPSWPADQSQATLGPVKVVPAGLWAQYVAKDHARRKELGLPL